MYAFRGPIDIANAVTYKRTLVGILSRPEKRGGAAQCVVRWRSRSCPKKEQQNPSDPPSLPFAHARIKREAIFLICFASLSELSPPRSSLVYYTRAGHHTEHIGDTKTTDSCVSSPVSRRGSEQNARKPETFLINFAE